MAEVNENEGLTIDGHGFGGCDGVASDIPPREVYARVPDNVDVRITLRPSAQIALVHPFSTCLEVYPRTN